MADYYQILGLAHTATSTEIRSAYKRLAMQYHPDRNPGNSMAEELFKQINEAYHVLSDPLKKSRYDSRFYSHQASTNYTEQYWRELRRQQQQKYPRYRAPEKRYAITGNYFKIQGLAFLVFLIMSGISFGIVHTASFFYDARLQSIRKEKRLLVEEVNVLFGSGKIDEAIDRIISLNKKEPYELQFRNAQDSLMDEIKQMGEHEFEVRNFERSLYYFEHLRKYQSLGRIETLRKISICQYNLGLYPETLQSLKQLHSEEPWNLELVYQIGILNINQLHHAEEALDYFNLGDRIFRENMTKIYGEAFMVMLDPKDAPEIYFEIFAAKANVNAILKHYPQAEKDLALAVYLRPERSEAYKIRAIMNINRQHHSTVCNDLKKAIQFGAEDVQKLQKKHCQ